MPYSHDQRQASVSAGHDGFLEGVGREAGHQNYLFSGLALCHSYLDVLRYRTVLRAASSSYL